MIEPLFDAAFAEAHKFKETRLYNELAEVPINLVDVGARWGPPPIFEALSELFHVVAFEPDPIEAKYLRTNHSQRGWASFQVFDVALGATELDTVINICERPNNSSLYLPDQNVVKRYKLDGYKVVSTRKVTLNRLDIFECYAEVLKIDVEGGELGVIQGGISTLASVQCTIVEADFWHLYKDAPLFSEVEIELRKSALRFYNLRDAHYTKGRLTHADAIFFRDGISLRAVMVQAVMALLLGFLDHYIEMVWYLPWGDEDRVPLLEFAALLQT